VTNNQKAGINKTIRGKSYYEVLIGSKREDRRNNRDKHNAGVNVQGHNRHLRECSLHKTVGKANKQSRII